jgi:DNA mismatch repair protein MutS
MTLPSPDGASPAIAQWFALKAEHPEALLFFRMGDFYELFFSDAEAAASALDIALTARGQHGGEPIPMCGVPCAAAGAYVARLIRRGFRVAVAEQTGRPRPKDQGGQNGSQKGILPRAIVRLITAGTLTEDELLEASRPNLLMALVHAPGEPARNRGQIGAAWIDVSTGLFETTRLAHTDLADLLGRLDPAEILAPVDLPLGEHEPRRAPVATVPAPLAARSRLAEAFGVASLDALGSFTDPEAMAAALALDYVRRTQAGKLPRLSRPASASQEATLGIDPATRASLELLQARDGGSAHTLFSAIAQTLTAAGGRRLAGWISAPLTDIARIAARQEGWAWLVGEPASATALRAALRGAPDIARALGRLSLGRGQPRDLAALRDGLACAREAAQALESGPLPGILGRAAQRLRQAEALRLQLSAALAPDLPARLDDGGVIASGFDGELDAERALRDDSRRVIATLQNDYAQRFGVASLKIKHHAQLGYVIEAPASAARALSAQPGVMLRQGTASLARISTDELAALDQRIAEAAERAAARERLVFDHIVQVALGEPALPALADALSLLDVMQSAARLAAGGLWCRAQVSDDASLVLRDCRHPVVQAALPRAQRFTPNGCDLSPDRRVMLLTGPNMAGKSTFLRQTALAVILAQAGLPVPAAEARIGVVDRLFSRVGAADDLARGRSTFMVEMTETAAILNLAGPRSLVVVDEIGRGTATLDGLAIAWAVLEALHSSARCRTIFATHFHELAQLAESLPRMRPHTMSVREWKGQVVFQHEVVEGAARRSWGVHVARLAGVPEPVVARAARLLATLERDHARAAPKLPLFAGLEPAPEPEPEPASPARTAQSEWIAALVADLAALDPDRLSPREALEVLYRLRARLGGSQDTGDAALHDVSVPAGENALG